MEVFIVMEGAGPGWRLGRALWIKAGQTSNPASLLLGLFFMSWPFCPLRFLFVLTSFMFSFRPLFREGKSLLHRKSGGLRLITNTWLACWRITRTLLLANRNTLSLNRESQTHNQNRSWGCQIWRLAILLLRTEARSSLVCRTSTNSSLFFVK